MEALKPCSPATCPMRASTCKYLLDFNPKYDKARTQWERERAEALRSDAPDRAARVAAIDARNKKVVDPVLEKDIKLGIVRCKADIEVPLNKALSLDEIARTFGFTRPRVQQIEARAKEKIIAARKEFQPYIGEPADEPAEE